MSNLEALPSESTPLLNNRAKPPPIFVLELERSIRAAVDTNPDADINTLHSEIRLVTGRLELREAAKSALELLLLLRLSSPDSLVPPNVQLGGESRDEALAQAWASLRAACATVDELSQHLWMPFEAAGGVEGKLFVMEELVRNESATRLGLMSETVVSREMLAVWKGGRPMLSEASSTFQRIENVATPRAFHLVDFVIHVLYLVALTDYAEDRRAIFYSVSSAIIDYRLYFVVIISLARCLTSSQVTRSPFFITLLAFVWKLIDTSPGSQEFCFYLLFFAYFQHFLHLLLPVSPCLVLLLPESLFFPLSSMLFNLLIEVIVPVFLFFFPIFVVLLIVIIAYFEIPFLPIFLTFDIPHEAAWVIVFYILCLLSLIILVLMFYVSVISATRSSSTPVQTGVPLPWNLYGPRVASSVRLYFFASVRHYSTPFFFPAPFNLIPFVLVTVPSLVLRICHQTKAATWLHVQVKPVLWRFIALPLGLLFGVVWGWRRS